MQPLSDHTVFVAGATGNIGPFIVRALLERGATVAVSSRSPQKLDDLLEHLGDDSGRLHAFSGEIGDGLRQRIAAEVGPLDAVYASLGDFVATPTLLGAGPDELRRSVDGYLISNFDVARTFVPDLARTGGTLVLVQGPLAFEPVPDFGTHLVTIATAGQHMLFRALAQELAGGPATVVELVVNAYVRGRETQLGSPLPAETVGAVAADLLADGADLHGRSIDTASLAGLRS